MGNYFECNLPENAPFWMAPEIIIDFDKMSRRVHKRMKVLEDALEISGLDGATFAKYAKTLFDNSAPPMGKFDSFTAEEIAQFAALMDDGTTATPRLEWPNADVVVDTAFVTVKEWELIRHIGIGGSDAAVILGESPYQTQRGLYHSKYGTPEKISDNTGDCIFERGHIMEDRVISAFCNLTGAKVIPETRMFSSKKYPHCIADIDAIVSFDDGRIFVFEAKTTVKGNWAAWANDKIPRQYVPQTRHYPAVLDDDRVLGTYIGCIFVDDAMVNNYYVGSEYDLKQFTVRFVDRDSAAEDYQLKTANEWFETFVENNDLPALSSDPKQEYEVHKKYVGQPDKSIPAQVWNWPDCCEAIQEYDRCAGELSRLSEQVDQYEKAKQVAVQALRDMLGQGAAATVEMDDGTYIEVKDSLRSKTKVDTDTLESLIEAASPFLPDEMAKQMSACIDRKGTQFCVFSVKRKKKK